MPGVVAAIRPRSTSGPSGTPRVCTREDRLAPRAVGRLHRDPAVEAPRAEQRRSSTSGRLVARDHDHARRRVEPVHLGEDLVQRLLALVVAAAEARDPGRARPADRVELVDEDDRRRRLLRLREQVAHARRRRRRRSPRRTRTPPSRRTARSPRPRPPARAASCPCPGGPESSTPCGMRPPSRRYFSGWRRKSTTSVSSAFASSIPATSANVTRSPDGSYRRARERPNEPSTSCMLSARRISQNSSTTNRIVGPKPNSRLCHHGAPRVERLGVDDDVLLLEQPRQRIVVGERGDLRLEARRRLRVLVRQLLRERALDGGALRRDLLDVPARHLLEEERAVRDAHPRLRPHRAAAEEEVDAEHDQAEDDPARTRSVPRAYGLRRRRVARRWRWRLFRGIVGGRHGPTLLLYDGAQPLAVAPRLEAITHYVLRDSFSPATR